MVTPTFTPPRTCGIAPGTSRDIEYRILDANFGDGYTQRMGDGINTQEEKTEVVFSNLTKQEKVEVRAFFDARKGYEAFWWTFPGDPAPTKWIAKKVKESAVHHNVFALSVSFEKVFDQ